MVTYSCINLWGSLYRYPCTLPLMCTLVPPPHHSVCRTHHSTLYCGWPCSCVWQLTSRNVFSFDAAMLTRNACLCVGLVVYRPGHQAKTKMPFRVLLLRDTTDLWRMALRLTIYGKLYSKGLGRVVCVSHLPECSVFSL